MASLKGRLIRQVAGLLLTQGTIRSVHSFGAFVRVHVGCDLKAIPAGTKLQLLLPSDDVRTYTPIPAPEGVMLLGWKHAASGPGARWLASVQAGDALPFVGPQRSLSLAAGPVVLVGDETSVAVAAAFAAERPGLVHAVIATQAPEDVRAAAAAVDLHAIDLVPHRDVDGATKAAMARLAEHPGATVALTGGSELVIGVRASLRAAGRPTVKTKPYWIPGRTGLD